VRLHAISPMFEDPQPRISLQIISATEAIDEDAGLTVSEARWLADNLTAAADEVDRWAVSGGQ